jgi:hypothetical protein
MKMPWTKRADEEKKRRLEAEARAVSVEEDWYHIRTHRKSIDQEVAINDWTATAISLFSGKEK